MPFSNRFRSCISFWLRSESFQKSGEEINSSVLDSSSRFFDASKIAPHSDRLLAERFILPREFIKRHETILPAKQAEPRMVE